MFQKQILSKPKWGGHKQPLGGQGLPNPPPSVATALPGSSTVQCIGLIGVDDNSHTKKRLNPIGPQVIVANSYELQTKLYYSQKKKQKRYNNLF